MIILDMALFFLFTLFVTMMWVCGGMFVQSGEKNKAFILGIATIIFSLVFMLWWVFIYITPQKYCPPCWELEQKGNFNLE